MNKDDETQPHVRTQSNSLLDDFIFKNERVLNIDHVDIDLDSLERPMEHIRRIDERLDIFEKRISVLEEFIFKYALDSVDDKIAELHARIDNLSNEKNK